jgi:hypothetical protein
MVQVYVVAIDVVSLDWFADVLLSNYISSPNYRSYQQQQQQSFADHENERKEWQRFVTNPYFSGNESGSNKSAVLESDLGTHRNKGVLTNR